MKVKIKKLVENAVVPFKTHENDFAYDVVATSRDEIAPNVFKYGIGLAFEIKWDELLYANFCIDFRPRSSVWKTGLVLSNCIGTVDSDYRGEVSAIFYKVSEGKPYEVGDRIGQICINYTNIISFELVDELSKTERGEGGYGSTGK